MRLISCFVDQAFKGETDDLTRKLIREKVPEHTSAKPEFYFFDNVDRFGRKIFNELSKAERENEQVLLHVNFDVAWKSKTRDRSEPLIRVFEWLDYMLKNFSKNLKVFTSTSTGHHSRDLKRLHLISPDDVQELDGINLAKHQEEISSLKSAEPNTAIHKLKKLLGKQITIFDFDIKGFGKYLEVFGGTSSQTIKLKS